MQRQGANKGATTAFLISTPESGVDSIAVTYALLDPIMTVVRPVAAMVTAVIAGVLENWFSWVPEGSRRAGLTTVVVDHEEHSPGQGSDHNTRSLLGKAREAIRFGMVDVWSDIALWFYVGLAIAAVITVIVPDALVVGILGGGLLSMCVMLVVGVPLYICATASTPIAAALIVKGVSPGAALVFLLVGPATNVTSLTVLIGMLGKVATARYLATLSACAVAFGLAVDQLYAISGIAPRAIIGDAAEIVPEPMKVAATAILLIFSIRPVMGWWRRVTAKKRTGDYFVVGFPDISQQSDKGRGRDRNAGDGEEK